MKFAESLRKLRLKHSWSEYQLAEKTGVKRNTLHSWERGRSLPNGVNLLKLAQVFDPIEQNELFESAGFTPLGIVDRTVLPSSFADMIREIERYYESIGIVELPIRGTVPGPPFSNSKRVVKYYPVSKARLAGAEPDTLYAMVVSGECFEENNIYDGDVIIVEEIAGFEDGKLYIVKYDNELGIQHIYWSGDKIALVSPDGKRQEFNASDVEILGRVILSGRWTRF